MTTPEHIPAGPVTATDPADHQRSWKKPIAVATAGLMLVGGGLILDGCTSDRKSDEVTVAIPADEIEAKCTAAADADIAAGRTAQTSLNMLSTELLRFGGSGPTKVLESYKADPEDRDAVIKELAESLPANPLAISIIGQGIVSQDGPTVSPDFVEVAVNRGYNNYLPANRDARIQECTGVIGALVANGEVGTYNSTANASITYVYENGIFKGVKTTGSETRSEFAGVAIRSVGNDNVEYVVRPDIGAFEIMVKDDGKANDDSEAESSASPSPSDEATNQAPANVTPDESESRSASASPKTGEDKSEDKKDKKTPAPIPSGTIPAPGQPSEDGEAPAPGNPTDNGEEPAPGNPTDNGQEPAPGTPTDNGEEPAPGTPSAPAPRPTTQPPSTQPPSTQPPSTQPPSTQPPSETPKPPKGTAPVPTGAPLE